MCRQRVALFGGPRRRRRRVRRNTGGWQQQRRATSRSASRCSYDYGNDDGRLHQGKGSARALHPAAGPALYKTGPVDCHRVPTSAPPGRKDGFYLHHDVEDVCRSDRRAAGVGEESAQGARSCDLEGNRAGLGCLEHLRNALSFAVVTEWPVGVYPRRRRWSPPHACLSLSSTGGWPIQPVRVYVGLK